MGSFGNASRKHLHRVTDALAVAVRGGNGDDVHAAFHERADVVQNPFAIQFAERIARGRNRRAADEMMMRVARGLELRLAFLRDALHVAHGDESVQMVVVVHHQQFVDADVLGEKFVGAGNRVPAQILLRDGVDLRARREGLGNFFARVTRFDDVAGKQPDQFSLSIHDWERAEAEFFLFDDRQHVADELFRRRP